jgi:predicted nucleic acid-binding protein
LTLRYLLDTNVISEPSRPKPNPTVMVKLRFYEKKIATATVVWHELLYVIVHELVHLLERNHGDRFKAYMSKFMPSWNFYQEELNCLPH